MVESPTPGTRRPGGRTAKVRRAVLDATLDELVEHGFNGLNLDQVATAAGVGKTTVYRRWRNAAGLVTDLLADLADQSVTPPDTGDLAGNLAVQAESVLGAITDPRLGATFAAIISGATCTESTSQALQRFHERRIDEWAGNIAPAIASGELPAGTDARELVRAVAAPLYYRWLVTREPVDADTARRSVTAALAAAQAGAFVRDSA